MIGGLQSVRHLCTRPGDAIRWACVLEATAPKAGNVFPGRDFPDLSYRDFVAAAEITSLSFDRDASFSHGVLKASSTISKQIGSNVNLGILLLIGPLVQADSAAGGSARFSRTELQVRVGNVLASMTADDAKRLYAAINLAAPGGMGKTEELDLAGPPPDDFLTAMRSAASRDRIARNYAAEFSDLFDDVLPTLHESILAQNDVLSGVAVAHLRLLAAAPDTLISRKFGNAVAQEVQRRASFDHDNLVERESFDRFLRSGALDLQGQSKQLNPGTTADLIAAALYVLLRDQS